MVQFTLPLFIAFPRLLDYIVVTEDPETYVIRGVVEWVSVVGFLRLSEEPKILSDVGFSTTASRPQQ